MEPPENDPWSALSSEGFEKINNLDNARMALRWAMERIRGLEKAKEDLAKKLEWQIKMRLRTEEDFKFQWENEKKSIEENFAARFAALEKEASLKRKEYEALLAEQRAKMNAPPPPAPERARPDTTSLRSLWEARKARLEKLLLSRRPIAAAPAQPPPVAAKPSPIRQSPPPPAPVSPPVQSKPAPIRRDKPPAAAPAADFENELTTARKTYVRAYQQIEKIAVRGWSGKSADPDPLSGVLKECLVLLQNGNRALLSLTSVSSRDNYQICHGLNTALLSMELSRSLGFAPETVLTLGRAGLSLDPLRLGLLGGGASAGESDEVRLHLIDSGKVSRHIAEAAEALKLITEGPAPESAAGLLALCDLYEALSHPRAWRNGLIPHEAAKTLAKDHLQDFGRPLLKAFLARFSLYPPGSYVKFSSGEIAWMASVHPGNFSLSVIEILLQRDGTPKSPAQLITLDQNPTSHIVRAADASDLQTTDSRLAQEIQSRLWWTP